jgi:hypothetical protein
MKVVTLVMRPAWKVSVLCVFSCAASDGVVAGASQFSADSRHAYEASTRANAPGGVGSPACREPVWSPGYLAMGVAPLRARAPRSGLVGRPAAARCFWMVGDIPLAVAGQAAALLLKPAPTAA